MCEEPPAQLGGKSRSSIAAQQGYDLKDYIHGGFVADWWGFTWMILAEARQVLTPEKRAAVALFPIANTLRQHTCEGIGANVTLPCTTTPDYALYLCRDIRLSRGKSWNRSFLISCPDSRKAR